MDCRTYCRDYIVSELDGEGKIGHNFSRCTFSPSVKIRRSPEVRFRYCTPPFPEVDEVSTLEYIHEAPSEILCEVKKVVFTTVSFKRRLVVPHAEEVIFKRCNFASVVLKCNEECQVRFEDCDSIPSYGPIRNLSVKEIDQFQLRTLGVRRLTCEYFTPSLTNLEQLEEFHVTEGFRANESSTNDERGYVDLILTGSHLTHLTVAGICSYHQLERLASLPHLESLHLRVATFSHESQSWLWAWKDHPTLFQIEAGFNEAGRKILRQLPNLTHINTVSRHINKGNKIGRVHLQNYLQRMIIIWTVLAKIYHSY